MGCGCATLDSGKLRDRDRVAELPLQSETDLDKNTTDYQCVFTRGGKCVTHGIVDRKQVNTSQTWDKKKNGLFGWIVKIKTTYVCQFEGVAMSNVCSDDDNGRREGVAKSNSVSGSNGQDETRNSSSALGGTDYQVHRDVGNKTRISGAEIKDAGCNNSERIRISSKEEELS